MSLKAKLQRWQKAGLIDSAAIDRILTFEQSRQGSRFSTAMLGLGALAIVLGFAAIIGSNWDAIPSALKLGIHILINLGLAAGAWYCIKTERLATREILLFLLAGFTLTFIALVGQIYQTGAPVWQALTLWLVLISPFVWLYARARLTIICWILALLITLGFASEAVESLLGTAHLEIAFYTIIPFLMIGVGHSNYLHQRQIRNWPILTALTGYVLVACVTSSSQMVWSDVFSITDFDKIRPSYAIAFATALIASGAIAWLRQQKYLVERPASAVWFLAISAVVAFPPWLIPHAHIPVLGAGIFMAYWALIGWTGMCMGYRGLLNAATVIIAIRLVIIYMEVFGNLLSTGFGLIISGILLIAVVWGTRHILKRLKKVAL